MFISKRCDCNPKTDNCCKSDKDISKLNQIFTVVSVKSRLEILFLLNSKSHCVCDITTHTKMSQSLISHHLADLMKLNLIKGKREGKFIDYYLTEKGKKVVQALESIIS